MWLLQSSRRAIVLQEGIIASLVMYYLLISYAKNSNPMDTTPSDDV